MDLSLFDIIDRHTPPTPSTDYKTPELPSLVGVDDVELNFETDGLMWWKGNLPIGFGLGWGDNFEYFPMRHPGGGNLDERQCYRFLQSLRGKHIRNTNTRFDLHMGREWGKKMGDGGLDFEEMGCTVSDVSHQAALLDDGRYHFNLDQLLADFAGGVRVPRLDESRLASYPAWMVAPRGRYQVEAVRQLANIFRPRLTAEGLHKVRELEEQVIFPVVEMEKNGSKIDVDLLDRWVKESEKEVKDLVMALYRETQLNVNPHSNESMQRLFEHLKLPMARTEEGNPSFTAEVLKAVDHPTIKRAIRLKKLISLRSKYLVPYSVAVDRSTGILRYSLNQLRCQKDPWSDDGKGTNTGRFSSSAPAEDEGVNIQQIMKAAKQRVEFGFEEEDESHDDEIYLIRKLHLPEEGDYLVSDAMQIEYRIFASETKSPRLIDIYKDEPLASFHKKTHAMLKEYLPHLTYRRQKDYNFANIYGAGLIKKALMLGYITKEVYEGFRAMQKKRDWSYNDDPRLKDIKEIQRIYDREIPEAKTLLDHAKSLAEERGWIRTYEGRLGRFKDFSWDGVEMHYTGEARRSHKSLNTRIQGSAADIMKRKIVELHRERKTTGFVLCFTVHDEVDGYAREGVETARRVSRILNRQSYLSVRVPILWEIGIGKNWMDAGKDSNQVEQAEIISECLSRRVISSHYKKDPEGEFAQKDKIAAKLNYVNTGNNHIKIMGGQ